MGRLERTTVREEERTIMRRLIGTIAVIALAWTGALSAHHSFSSEFDSNRPIRLEGTVTKMLWMNPHPWIHIEVKGPDGKPVEWMIEAGAPNALLRRGFNKNSLPAGTLIVVEGYQARDGANRMNAADLTFPDGRKLFLGSEGTGAPSDARKEAK
jgi:hypothetical protein